MTGKPAGGASSQVVKHYRECKKKNFYEERSICLYYYTIPITPEAYQISFTDFFCDTVNLDKLDNDPTPRTLTRQLSSIPEGLRLKANAYRLRNLLQAFNVSTQHFDRDNMQQYYHTFFIPKSSGGTRRIDAPNEDLMDALHILKQYFEEEFHATYHTSAFAYVKKRNTVAALRKHQENGSHWYCKLDFHNFFGSVTLDFTMSILSTIYPFSVLMEMPHGTETLRETLSLCFLNGGLPQGTPISPMLTNIIMIPLDFAITHKLVEMGNAMKQYFVYTRYADDMLISSRRTFDQQQIVDMVENVVADFNAPFVLNKDKTRYGSRAGSNWNLGLMINKDNQISIGYRKKKVFKAMLNNYICDRNAGHPWNLHDVQTLSGLTSYYRSIEKNTILGIINKFNEKYHVNVQQMIREDIRGLVAV
ncbi:MAG TPA: reverse transcriptase domain-containing protein [Saprospiraceae bacterium]|nr:reverse transcriptase domain-containing protein [Saprospiraceae bacterium]